MRAAGKVLIFCSLLLLQPLSHNIFCLTGTLLCGGASPELSQQCSRLAERCFLIKVELALVGDGVGFKWAPKP